MKHCIIDIGTNTVKTNIYEIDENGEFRCVLHDSVRCSLGLCRINGKLNELGRRRLLDTLEKFIRLSHENDCTDIYTLATASLRDCDNVKEICNEINDKLGMAIDVISGENEAMYGYTALRAAKPDAESGLMSDLGGGSCELVLFENGRVKYSTSLPLGAVLLASEFNTGVIPDSDSESAIEHRVRKAVGEINANTLYAAGGTARGIFKLYRMSHGDADSLSADEAERFYRKIKENERAKALLKAQLPQRYDVFMTGFFTLLALLRACGGDRLTLCEVGVREGYLVRRVLKR